MIQESGKHGRNVSRQLRTLAGVCAVGAAAFLLGRATAGEAAYQPQILSLPSVLAKHPLAKDEPFRIIPVVQGRDASVTVVRAARELPPHYHNEREEVVYVVRGGGTMQIGEEKRPVKAGDILYLPRKVPHGFSNGAKQETVVVSVMSPPFDGKDRIFLRAPEGAKP
ncbi:MAG: cupin domain-containing protein [Armatimonadetes bacterium]|nr:cupin domain-containing protein [Armatimonadota bacterium]